MCVSRIRLASYPGSILEGGEPRYEARIRVLLPTIWIWTQMTQDGFKEEELRSKCANPKNAPVVELISGSGQPCERGII